MNLQHLNTVNAAVSSAEGDESLHHHLIRAQGDWGRSNLLCKLPLSNAFQDCMIHLEIYPRQQWWGQPSHPTARHAKHWTPTERANSAEVINYCQEISQNKQQQQSVYGADQHFDERIFVSYCWDPCLGSGGGGKNGKCHLHKTSPGMCESA